MTQKVKILSKYSIDAIDYEAEKKRVDSILKDRIENLGTNLDDIKIINDKDNKTKDDIILLNKVVSIERDYSDAISKIDEYKELVVTSAPAYTEIDQAIPYYEEEKGKVNMFWEIIKNDPVKISKRIISLTKDLSDSDYKIIKCYEASLLKQEVPYDIESITTDRSLKRNEINRLKSILNNK